MLLGVERGLVIDATDKMESNGPHILKVSTLERLIYILLICNDRSGLNNDLAREQQRSIIALLVHRLLHDIAKALMGLIQIVNTTDNKFRPKANVFRNGTSKVAHRDVKHQHSAPLVENEI